MQIDFPRFCREVEGGYVQEWKVQDSTHKFLCRLHDNIENCNATSFPTAMTLKTCGLSGSALSIKKLVETKHLVYVLEMPGLSEILKCTTT